MAQFLDLNLKIGGVDIDGVADARAHAHRSGRLGDRLPHEQRSTTARGLAQAAIIDLPAPANVEIHTPYHAYALEARHRRDRPIEDNHAIWHTPRRRWLPRSTRMDDVARGDRGGRRHRPDGHGPREDQGATVPRPPTTRAGPARCQAAARQALRLRDRGVRRLRGSTRACRESHDTLECQLKPISAADYAGAVPARPTAGRSRAARADLPAGRVRLHEAARRTRPRRCSGSRTRTARAASRSAIRRCRRRSLTAAQTASGG